MGSARTGPWRVLSRSLAHRVWQACGLGTRAGYQALNETHYLLFEGEQPIAVLPIAITSNPLAPFPMLFLLVGLPTSMAATFLLYSEVATTDISAAPRATQQR